MENRGKLEESGQACDSRDSFCYFLYSKILPGELELGIGNEERRVGERELISEN